MWKAETGHNIQEVKAQKSNDDDWETDGEVNAVSEKQQRWAGGREVHVDVPLKEFAAQVAQKHTEGKLNEYSGNSFARGYGGKNGVEVRSKDDADAKIKIIQQSNASKAPAQQN
ncbi:hypothetical protein MIR68_000147 [Amoeboaphelidium protococcarum]|nr:hypothetical protein MIR68_000147 [Amoeboaphelidium protococcarum]KAI3652086.1 hypothetical protein MP228_003389 [Amoeboaphelidium protococcarum]